MEIHRLKESEVDELYSFLKGKPGVSMCMSVKPFLVQSCRTDTNPIYVNRGSDGGFQNVFSSYSTYAGLASSPERKMGNHLVKQYSSGNMLEFLQEISKQLKGRIVLENIEKEIGERNGWKFEDTDLELTVDLSGVEPGNLEADVTEENKEDTVKLLSQEWWTEDQARDFLESVLRTDNCFAKIVVEDGKAVAFAEAAHDGEKAYIEAVYVDKDSRHKGIGTRVSQAILSRLAGLGVKQAILGVDGSNKAARTLYENLGFRHNGSTGYIFVMRE